MGGGEKDGGECAGNGGTSVPNGPLNGAGSGGGGQGTGLSGSTQERLMRTAAMISSTKHLRKANLDAGEYHRLISRFESIYFLQNLFCYQQVFVNEAV